MILGGDKHQVLIREADQWQGQYGVYRDGEKPGLPQGWTKKDAVEEEQQVPVRKNWYFLKRSIFFSETQ